MRTGTFCVWACGGKKRLNFISHFVVVAAWLSFRSLPPKEAMVAFVVTDILYILYVVYVVMLEGGKRTTLEEGERLTFLWWGDVPHEGKRSTSIGLFFLFGILYNYVHD